MNVSNAVKIAAEIIKKSEGYFKKIPNNKVTAYLDPVKIPTIGWGSTYHLNGTAVKMGDILTLAQAEQLMAADITRFTSAILKNLKTPVTDEQLAALISFTYNSGVGVQGGKTGLINKDFFKVLNATGDSTRAAAILEKTNLTGRGNPKPLAGLIIRRKEEAALLRQKKKYSIQFVGWNTFFNNIGNIFKNSK